MDDVPDEPDLLSASDDDGDDADKVAEGESGKPGTETAVVKVTAITDSKAAGRFFVSHDYVQAEALYTKALNTDPFSPLLYTNRAMARLKLELYDGVVEDCMQSLKLLPHNMKAHYYRAQALLELGRPAEALLAAKEAYQLAYLSGDRAWERSLGNIVGAVLRSKKAVWEEKEAKRLKGRNALRDEVVAGLKEVEMRLGVEAGKEYKGKIEEVIRVWEKAGEGDEKKREVPDWIIDDITFCVMVDPVIVSLYFLPCQLTLIHPTSDLADTNSSQTKTGNSYERASIMEHLRRSATDPLTREPLTIDELRPNLALREACEEFLKENGWAVDY